MYCIHSVPAIHSLYVNKDCPDMTAGIVFAYDPLLTACMNCLWRLLQKSYALQRQKKSFKFWF